MKKNPARILESSPYHEFLKCASLGLLLTSSKKYYLKTEESPHCKVKLSINLKPESYIQGGEKKLMCMPRDMKLMVMEMKSSYGLAKPLVSLHFAAKDLDSRLNFTHEAQFLLISEESVSDLSSRLSSNVKEGTYGAPVQVNPMRFQPNLVISGGEPYAEDGWRNLKIENQHFTSLGGCNRCQMINFDHKDEQVLKSNEPLGTLASDRRAKGKILFGILLKNNSQEPDSDSYLEVGQEIHPNL
ncbi:hypothetical protein ACOSQ3_016940 [Xanthoceras sorbifolium]